MYLRFIFISALILSAIVPKIYQYLRSAYINFTHNVADNGKDVPAENEYESSEDEYEPDNFCANPRCLNPQ